MGEGTWFDNKAEQQREAEERLRQEQERIQARYSDGGYRETIEQGAIIKDAAGYHKGNRAVISMFRHGDKVGEDLSSKGFKQMLEKGATTEVAGSRVKGYHSPFLRAEQSVEAMTAALAAEAKHSDFRKGVTRERQELNFQPFSKAGLEFYGKEKLPGYWALGDKRPDEKSLSPYELANRAAAVLDAQIHMVGRLDDGSAVNLADASHSPTLDVLILRLLKEELEKDPVKQDGTTEVDKMGGALNVAEGFEVDARTDDQGTLSATIKFRGKEYQVNLQKLRGMVEEYQKPGYGNEVVDLST